MNVEYVTVSEYVKKHDETINLLKEINDRLYKDNGKKSIQTQLNEHGNVINSVQRALWLFYGAIVLAIVSGVAALIFSRG